MIEAAFAIPGDLATPTGGYAYDRRVMAALPAAGVVARHVALPSRFPHPTADDLRATEAALRRVPAGVPLLIDGLALGVLPAALLRGLPAPVVALIHHPLALETGLTPERRAALAESERAALACADEVIVTGAATAALLREEYGVPGVAITIAEPGTDRAERARGGGDPPRLLAVGALVPRKGYDTLVAALAMVRTLPWTLTIVGSLDRDPACVAALRAQIAEAGLADRITLAGAASEAALEALYAAADLFVLASRFEGYGMVLAEAAVRGLPIVATAPALAAAGFPPETASAVPAGNASALAAAIFEVLGDRTRLQRLADASWRYGASLPRWRDTAARIAAVLARVAAKERAS